MAEYSRLAQGTVTTLNGPTPVYLPFVPDYVSYTVPGLYTSSAADQNIMGFWCEFMAPSDGIGEFTSPSSNLATQSLYPGGISPIINGTAYTLGSPIQISSVAKGSPTVITTSSPHGLTLQDTVILSGLYQSPGGMPQICGIPFGLIVSIPSTTSFEISWDTSGSNYTAITMVVPGAYVRQVLGTDVFTPNVTYISSLTPLGDQTLVVTPTPHNMYAGQEVAFRIPPEWGAYQFNSLSNKKIPGAPKYAVVTSVTAPNNLLVNVNSQSFEPFTVNVPVSQVPGLTWPQLVAVGDYNMGSVYPPTGQGGQLYPSPIVNSYDGYPTQNGPAVSGAFINNTSQGFLIGNTIVSNMPASSVIFYDARKHDLRMGFKLPSL